MSGALKSYVEKFLLNPAASFNVDDEDNQDGKAQVVDGLQEGERAEVSQYPVSKLRARSAALQAERDPRYRGKKVLRKDLVKDTEVEFDQELTKYFLVESGEEKDDDEEDNGSEEMVDGDDGEEEEDEVDEEDEDDESGSEGVGEGENDISQVKKDTPDQQHKSQPSGLIFNDDGDFSKFADMDDNDDDDDDDDDDDEDDDDSDDSEEEDDQKGQVHTFSIRDQSGEVEKGQAVKNQLARYDSLFESRISLQKVVMGSNQLPQHSTFRLFLQQRDPHYNKNLQAARSAARHLQITLLDLQELLLRQNPETSHIISGKKPKSLGTESDEEITSSEDENEVKVEDSGHGEKRKLSLEECEGVLSKRHAAMIPFRDITINKWYEKTKLLSSRSGGNKFGAFEVSALQQVHNILSNKQSLVRRTQLTGATRGTAYQVLGQPPHTQLQTDSDEYDPEIFDDTDFYTRLLEEVLKSKVALSDNMTDVSRKWIEIQNLRKKAKRKVDRKSTKGRKIRYEVLSKLQQYLAPCQPPKMDDAAINILFASLFGGPSHNTNNNKSQEAQENTPGVQAATEVLATVAVEGEV